MARQTREAYSCGDSSGIQPDSLFSLAPQLGSGHLYSRKDTADYELLVIGRQPGNYARQALS